MKKLFPTHNSVNSYISIWGRVSLLTQTLPRPLLILQPRPLIHTWLLLVFQTSHQKAVGDVREAEARRSQAAPQPGEVEKLKVWWSGCPTGGRWDGRGGGEVSKMK